NQVKAALGALEALKRGKDGPWLALGCYRQSGSHQRIVDLERADERQAYCISCPGMNEFEALAEPVDFIFDELNTLPAPSNREQSQAALFRGRHHGICLRVINVDHGCAAWFDEIGEQPELGREIMFRCRMIVEMIARDI